MHATGQLTWKHQSWESVVRDLLQEYDFVNTDEILRHVLSYVSDNADDASEILQEIYENEYASFMDIMSDILDSTVEMQEAHDHLRDTDYGWEKGSQKIPDSEVIKWEDNKEVYGDDLSRALYYYIDIELYYDYEEELSSFLESLDMFITNDPIAEIYKKDVIEDLEGGVLTVVVHPAPDGLKEKLEREFSEFSVDISEYSPYL